jgi:RimJ/RimL family protein N-acetyltransferase
MDVRFARVELAEIQDAVQQHLESLPRPIDSFLEDHILESTHYRILIDEAPAGFASIHKTSLITQFCLAEPHKTHGQAAFQRLRKLESVTAAFVPTCDEFLLAHAIDDYRQLAKQAYFFTVGRDPVEQDVIGGCSLRPADLADTSFVREQSGEFFEDVEKYIRAGELFLTTRDDRCVGFGLLVRSRFYRDVASIGMFTIEPFRCTGVGTATIALLIAECRTLGLRAAAGCWYYNHLSKRTLESAGMVTQTRLLKIEY